MRFATTAAAIISAAAISCAALAEPILRPSPGAMPIVRLRSVDLRPQIKALGLEPRNQAPRITCSIFATVFLMEYMTAKATHATTQPYFSVEFMNWAANTGTGHLLDGGYFEDVAEGYAKYGIVPEADLPYANVYDPDMVISATLKATGLQNRTLQPRMIRYNDKSWGITEEEFAAIRQSLDAGVPVAAGFQISSAPVTKTIGNVIVWDSLPANGPYGAHSMALVGYQITSGMGGGYFIVRNSYGYKGDQGYVYVSFDYARKNIADAIVFEIPSKPITMPVIVKRKMNLPDIVYAGIPMVSAATAASRLVQ